MINKFLTIGARSPYGLSDNPGAVCLWRILLKYGHFPLSVNSTFRYGDTRPDQIDKVIFIKMRITYQFDNGNFAGCYSHYSQNVLNQPVLYLNNTLAC